MQQTKSAADITGISHSRPPLNPWRAIRKQTAIQAAGSSQRKIAGRYQP